MIVAAAVAAVIAVERDSGASAKPVEPFIAEIRRGVLFDYDPLASARAAHDMATEIVVGRLEGVMPGSSFSVDGRELGTYVALAVRVDRVLKGADRTSQLVYVLVAARGADVEQLVRLAPKGAEITAVLAESASEYSPLPEAKRGTSPEVEAGSAHYAHIDGVWLAGRNGEALGLLVDGLAPGWGIVRSYGDYVAALTEAAARVTA